MAQPESSSDAFNDSLNFVKNLWGQMSVPGMAMPSMSGMSMPGMQGMTIPGITVPSMSVDDLDKRIQELKTVENWLNLNMTMLRNTIQALEVQRATIATLHSLSKTMSDTMKGMSEAGSGYTYGGTSPSDLGSHQETGAGKSGDASGKPAAQSPDGDISPLISQSAAWWQGVQDQFKLALGSALEKGAANYAAVKTASEKVVSASAAQKPAHTAASPRKSSPASGKPVTRSGSKTRATATARSAAKKKTVAKAPETPKLPETD